MVNKLLHSGGFECVGGRQAQVRASFNRELTARAHDQGDLLVVTESV